MKKDRMRELLTELRDREFGLEECCKLFMYINVFMEAGVEKTVNTNPKLIEYYHRQFEHYRTELELLLFAYGLTDYTLDEFITED